MRLAKRFYPKVPTVRQTSIGGFPLVVWANEHIGQRILAVGRFESDEMRLFPEFVGRGDTCIDVGANIGVHTVNLARAVGEAGRVIAFEPFRKNALLVSLNCELNDLRNVSVVCAPVSAEAERLLSPVTTHSDSACASFGESADGVPSVTLDAFCAENGVASVSFIKIDVEGGELEVLKGASQLLTGANRPATVVVEVVDEHLSRFGQASSDLVHFMTERGYVAFVLRDGELQRANLDQIQAENVFFRRPS